VVGGRQVLYVNWLTLRNPRGLFRAGQRPLPGQDAPGLGLAHEVGELFARAATRLGLAGVAFRPSWYHTAYAARHRLEFVDPARQGRFEALIRDLGALDLGMVTRALAHGRVRSNGSPYAWEADEMVGPADGARPTGDPARAAAVAAERERVHFTVE
jgi:hypothetical protein